MNFNEEVKRKKDICLTLSILDRCDKVTEKRNIRLVILECVKTI